MPLHAFCLKCHIILGIAVTVLACRDNSSMPQWAVYTSPAGPDSEAPNLHTGPDGSIYMSWIEWTPDTTSILNFSRYDGTSWVEKREVARGNNWFVNWADFPSITAFEDGHHLAAHWLQMSGAGQYDYQIMVSVSPDQGQTWRTPFILHRDTRPGEHGFVSTVRDGDKIFFCWLDGRKMAGEDHTGGHGSHSGSMLLIGGWLDTDGILTEEMVLDSMTCECCQTAAARTETGLVVAYRDRTDGEIRDISHVAWDGKKWTAPQTISPDHWKIAGCPVNGPSLSYAANVLGRVWYGIAEHGAHVSFLMSKDDGKNWQSPIHLDVNQPLGRVDIAMDQANAFVSWIGRDHQDSTRIMVAQVSTVKGRFRTDTVCAIDPRRKSGFPVLAVAHDQVLLAYTHVDGESSRVNVMRRVKK